MTIYAIVEDNIVSRFGTIKELYPNTIFGSRAISNRIKGKKLYKVIDSKNFNTRTEKLVNVDPYFENDACYSVQVVAKTAEQIQVDIDYEWRQVRATRDSLLFQCDWTVLPDTPVDSQVWLQYRQQLRDITTQADPFEISWPVAPSLNSNNNESDSMVSPSTT